MASRYSKVSEIANKYRVSVDAVYLWIRQGNIPADCVIRIAGTVRVDEEEFERRLRNGSLYQARGRKTAKAITAPAGTLSGEDNFTTTQRGPRIDHRWTSETCTVTPDHPFSPSMVRSEK